MARSSYIQAHEVNMEFADIPGTQLQVSRVALGTWAMGGWMWGGTDERESVQTIWAALDQGINLSGWKLDAASLRRIDRILSTTITDPVGPEFMAPQQRPDYVVRS